MRVISAVASVIRGLGSRAGSSVMTLVVAVVAVGAATAGPTYYTSSQSSIVQDNLQTVPVLGRGYEVTQYGSVVDTLQLVQNEVSTVPGVPKDFAQPVDAIEATAIDPNTQSGSNLVWRTDICAHLQIVHGSCPVATNQVMVSTSFASSSRVAVGDSLAVSPWGPLKITGVYTPPNIQADYWFDRGTTYFPYENPGGPGGPHGGASEDAMFTPESTLSQSPASEQGEAVIDEVLNLHDVHPAGVKQLGAALTNLVDNQELEDSEAVVSSDIPQTMSAIQTAWSALAVPVLLITLQLLGLAWLLLFLIVSEATASRGPEVALAKLRGHGRARTVLFGLSEPLGLVGVSLPLGAVAGWAATLLLAHSLLRPGTPVGLPALSWAAAGAATVGGFAAIVMASGRTLRRPVVEQWRRASTSVHGRTWVADSILLTGAVAGLAELALTGKISSAHHNALSLLVPGLMGVAVAVVASRLLPLLCRAGTRAGRGRGLASYLALRHVARRPGGSRTTIMLATSFALATFALAGWALDQTNVAAVARAQVGAPKVLDVIAPSGSDLGALVAEADPSGRMAAAVEEYGSNGTVTIAVDPAPWSKVAYLSGALPAGETPADFVRALTPPEPPALILNGDAVRLTFSTQGLGPANSSLILDVDAAGGAAPTPVEFGILGADGTDTLTGSLVGCPCTVQDISVQPPPGLVGATLEGTLDLQQLSVEDGGGWQTVAAGLAAPGHWTAPTNSVGNSLTPDGSGLRWSFLGNASSNAILSIVDRPAALPAFSAAPLTGKGAYNAYGLDGSTLTTYVEADLKDVPGAPADGVVVDRRFAELAADGDLYLTQQQVWLAKDAPANIEARLEAEGVKITSSQTESGAAAAMTRQGPGLARILFLGEGGVAAALAAGGAILGLYLTSRRRRYELAALVATGVKTRVLMRALAAEQLIVVAFGVLVGVATGIAAALIALRDVPEFLTQPAAPALAAFPPIAILAITVGITVAVVLIASFVASVTLARSIHLDQLREAPS